MSIEEKSGTRDATYDLVSVMYHALHGVETYEQYVDDAERAGDRELADFLRDVQARDRETAEGAKQLLAGRLA
jgi:hypothetical protein